MKKKNVFECSSCGYQSPKWMGKCIDCNEWNTFEEKELSITKNKSGTKIEKTLEKSVAKKLTDVKERADDRILTNISEFDRVMGGGIVRDSVTILTSPPAGGKSTICLKIAYLTSRQNLKVLYASGEESESQIKSRANRILENINDNLWIISDNRMDNVLEAINFVDADIIIIDSIQTFILDEFLPSRQGSPTQTMECATALTKIAKNNTRPRAVIMIGQMNKQDEIAGLRALEHLVDTVLIIEGENEEELRAVVVSKNRFGSAGEVGFFSMTEKGMISIDNPSEFFMTKREDGEIVCGSALTVVKEGSRAIITEIESLVSQSFTAYPTRIGETLGKDKLNTLISILEQRGGINLYDKNVIIKTTGGINIKEQAINLSVIMSIVSSVKNKGINSDIAFIADVGLTGELKKVPALEGRIKELSRMGFKKVYVAKDSFLVSSKIKGIVIVECKTLNEVIKEVYRK